VTSELVLYDINGRDLPEGLESLPQILFGDLARQIANVNIHLNLPFAVNLITEAGA